MFEVYCQFNSHLSNHKDGKSQWGINPIMILIFELTIKMNFKYPLNFSGDYTIIVTIKLCWTPASMSLSFAAVLLRSVQCWVYAQNWPDRMFTKSAPALDTGHQFSPILDKVCSGQDHDVNQEPVHRHSPILDEVGPVGDDDGGEDGLGPGVVVGQVRPHPGYWETEHIVQLAPVHAAGHLVLHRRKCNDQLDTLTESDAKLKMAQSYRGPVLVEW